MDREARARILRIFPGLRNDCQFKVTSPITRGYNCFSWSNGWNDRWTFPNIDGHEMDFDEYWPDDLPNDDSIENIIAFFLKQGFSPCPHVGSPEDAQYIALYYNSATGKATHAARQLSNGLWTSKLGYWEDIQHGSPESLEGDFYGKIYCYMKK